MTKNHIIYIPFVGVGINKRFSQEWFADRIEIFKNYTLKSLLNQTNKDFTLWLSFRPEDLTNPLIESLSNILQQSGLRFVMTFDGLMYWDDRNETVNNNLEQRINSSLISLRLLDLGDLIYLTRLDSDDMLSRMAVDHIQHGWVINVEALVFRKGYIYNKELDQLAKWEPPTNPPFHTLVMSRETFLDPKKHLAFYKNFKSHEDIVEQFSYLTLPDGQFCVFTHNPEMHISTVWGHKFKGDLIPEEDKEKIKQEFGICLK